MTNEQKRDELCARAVRDPDGKTVHWGKQTFTVAEYGEFWKNMQGLHPISSQQLEVLQAVHDGKPVPGTAEHVSPTGMTAEQLLDKAGTDTNGNLTIGELTVDKAVAEDFKKSLAAKPADPELAAMVEEASKEKFHIGAERDANSHGGSREVTWDSKHAGIDSHNDAIVAPSRVLKHELSHALRPDAISEVLQRIPDGQNDNREERAAIECENRHADPHQMARHSHHGRGDVSVKDPTQTPQVSRASEISVFVADVKDGKRGESAYKSSGRIEGKVESITTEKDENNMDRRVLHMRNESGKTFDVMYNTAPKDPKTNPGGFKGRMEKLGEEVRPGDDITLAFDQGRNTASLENRTQQNERTIDGTGRFVAGRTHPNELAVNVARVGDDGAPGAAFTKTNCQLRGTVTGITHKDGVETITLKDQRGHISQVSFNERSAADPSHASAMKTLTEDVKTGADITLALDAKAERGTLENRTEHTKLVVDPHGQMVDGGSLDVPQRPERVPVYAGAAR
jgi:hypothetical protein